MAKAAAQVLERTEEPTPAPAPAAPAPVAVPVAAVPKHFRIHDRDVHDAAKVSVRWHIDVTPDIPYEAILHDRGFWANVVRSKGMQIGNILEIHVADNSYYAELVILDVGSVWAKVAQIIKVDFEKQTTAGDADVPGYTLNWDRLQKHYITRDKDKQVIAHGFATKNDAQAALVDYVHRIGR